MKLGLGVPSGLITTKIAQIPSGIIAHAAYFVLRNNKPSAPNRRWPCWSYQSSALYTMPDMWQRGTPLTVPIP